MRPSKVYISADVETTGQYPWNSSMIAIGACVVERGFERTFYRELKPISREYLRENFKIGASSLKCLSGYDFSNFNPEEVLAILHEKGDDPRKAMEDFVKWVKECAGGHKPRLAAAPILFDGMFISYYIDQCTDDPNPFGYSGEDINSAFKGVVRDMAADIDDLGLREKTGLRHNALEDAVQQAKEFYTALVNIRQHQRA